IFEIFMLLPRLFLIILMVAIFGNNIYITMFVVAITIWPTNARITRAQVSTLRNRLFVKAYKSAGASDLNLLFTHILPNGIYPVIVNSTLQMGRAIITEAGLSFLGLGDINHISWGQILLIAQNQLTTWWLALFPGLAICIIVLAFNFVGGGINYALNPRMREIYVEL
ncbi:ABC transporter permease, partial [Thermoproteota archaeon]